MNNVVYTIQELQSMKFYELPNCIYNRIITELRNHFGFLTTEMISIFNRYPVTEIDQYVNIYKYILVI